MPNILLNNNLTDWCHPVSFILSDKIVFLTVNPILTTLTTVNAQNFLLFASCKWWSIIFNASDFFFKSLEHKVT